MKVQKIKEFPINGQDSIYLVKLLEDEVYEIDHINHSRRASPFNTVRIDTEL